MASPSHPNGIGIGSGSRNRAVSSSSALATEDEHTAALLHDLDVLDLSTWAALRDTLSQSDCLQQLRFALKDHDGDHNPQDSFRRQSGFQTVLHALHRLSRVWDQAQEQRQTKYALHFLSQFFSVLGAALEHHPGNNRYFRTKLEGGGWPQVEAVTSDILGLLEHEAESELSLEGLFGVLLATSVGTESVADIYVTLEKTGRGASLDVHTLRRQMEERITRDLRAADKLIVPELLTVLVHGWSSCQRRSIGTPRSLAMAIPLSIDNILAKSRQHVVGAHVGGLLQALQPLLFGGSRLADEDVVYRTIALKLYALGVANLDDACSLLEKALDKASTATFLLECMRASRSPPSIQFDLAHHGSSSVELANLRKPFPSPDATGYTLSLWACFDKFDPDAHTTLFGAFDRTQTCFVLAYLEKDTQHLILQTSISGSRPSVRFKSTSFDTSKWYHICIVHRKPRAITSSRASLFIDGEFVEQVKATFPVSAPVERASGVIRVQAFLGTPADLSPSSSGMACVSRWSLAAALLIQDSLSDDMVNVVYNLGPAYYGNYQDCLGSFQTYKASAALNLRNESLNPGREDVSDLMLAVRFKAGTVIREDTILLNLSPATVLDNDDRNNIDESQLVRSLSKVAAKNLLAYTRTSPSAIAVNGAVPAINDALVQTNGIAVLMGEPVVTAPHTFDDALWCLGGCAPIILSLVDQARTTEAVIAALDVLLEAVNHSWRNSEVMERHSGYSILGNLLREKLTTIPETSRASAVLPTPAIDRGDLGVRVFRSILAFLGYNAEDESKSLLINPLAYKVLVIDTSLWRCHSIETQELFFRQIAAFAVKSLYSKFNVKRLNRMRALRRLLEALKGEPVPRTIMPYYVMALKALLPTSMSAEMLRSVSLFITYSIHKRSATSRSRKRLSSNSSSRTPSVSTPRSSIGHSHDPCLSRFEIGVEVLRMFSNMLCAPGDTIMIRKFAKTVTNKWLLYLLSETHPEVVVLSVRILSRLLIVHGEAYVKKFKEKSLGFAIMAHRLKRWWHLPAVWPTCFAILFGVDVAELDLERPFDLHGFSNLFESKQDLRIAYPAVLEVIMAMLQSGLRAIASSKRAENTSTSSLKVDALPSGSPHRLSMSAMAPPSWETTQVLHQHIETINTIIDFLADLQSRSPSFRDYAANSSFVQDLFAVIYPVVVGSDVVDAVVELNARDAVLSLDGTDVTVPPFAKLSLPIKSPVEENEPLMVDNKSLRRGSSFILVRRDLGDEHKQADSSKRDSAAKSASSISLDISGVDDILVQGILEILVETFTDQILVRKDFPGLGIFLKTPAGFIEHQRKFESWILRNTVSKVSSVIAANQLILTDPKTLTNVSRFFAHLGDAVFEGWYAGGAEAVLDLAGSVLEYLQQPDVAQMKGVRLCTLPIATIRNIVFRIVMLSLSHIEDSQHHSFLAKLTYWQNVLLSSDETKSAYLRNICFLLYGSLVSSDHQIRLAAANLWRIVLVQKPTETSLILAHANPTEFKELATKFEKLVELDNETFLVWVDEHRAELDVLFSDQLSQTWNDFVDEENGRTEDAAKSRISRRREKLKSLAREEADREELIRRHEITSDHWTNNIYSSEHLKHQRLLQDHQDDRSYSDTAFRRMSRDLHRSTRLFALPTKPIWRLDQTEGRNRMRIRLAEDFSRDSEVQQPKRKGSAIPSLKLDTRALRATNVDQPPPASAVEARSARPLENDDPFPDLNGENGTAEAGEVEESFEIVEDPNAGQDDEFEDKNRKVMRSLHRGDQVKHVANVSRIAGLEAVEGLLILGKDYVYLIDNFFERSDGQIVNVWEAPQEERDDYIRMISGRDVAVRKQQSRAEEHEGRSWKWSEVISVSKRRFLFRDVAIEMFFGDGRSYLLTSKAVNPRNDLYSRIVSKAPQYGSNDSPQSEFAWRYETLKSAEEEPQTFGARFVSAFSQTTHLTATKKWQRGEMSNFHYLMIINTMAGRTYNDLTQYPVFPWVISDYTSDELDLNNPKVFRDLSKPMGCQTLSREAEFRERYKTFAEMADHNAPPFHYGTHYSSAMIVTSYLIRLQPFVKSFLLLQGGSFDHADRMFFSVEQAWRSASQVNMTDVRELTPEFFYLPEFLTNPNDYDFGTRQASQKSIGNVELPPWAKGDPRIFIAKHREALESPHVSKHLHKWIDLIFGCKQKGEAAIEAVNVFHHLSYQGAKDLDAIQDDMERLATIGIIHNFGQTPYQIFPRAHPARDSVQHQYKRIDTAAESLTRLPSTVFDNEEKVASLTYAWKSDRLLCSGAFRLYLPPNYDKYMEWGFFDGSIRFYSADSKKEVGLFEHLHIGQLSGAVLAGSKTLVTAGTDCTVAVWTVINSSKTVDLQLQATLFGHRRPITTLAVSRSFNALLTASSDGELIMWDLNRYEYVRRIETGQDLHVSAAAINDVTGNIVICHGSMVSIFSLNGDFMLSHDTSDRGSTAPGPTSPDDAIMSVTCYEGAGNEWLERDILFTGHKRGIVKVWSLVINPRAGQPGEKSSFELELIRQLNHVDPTRDNGANVAAGITCILSMPQVVYTGDEDGRVCEWNCVQRH